MEFKGTVRNADGEVHEYHIDVADPLDSVIPCTGPCECDVEPDGHCPDGWPSVLLDQGLI